MLSRIIIRLNNTKIISCLFRTLKERLRSHVELLTRQARLKTMKKGQIFMTFESRIGAKKTKSNDR